MSVEINVHIQAKSKRNKNLPMIKNGKIAYHSNDNSAFLYDEKYNLMHKVKNVEIDFISLDKNEVMFDFYGKIDKKNYHVFSNTSEKDDELGNYLFTSIEVGVAFK